MKPTPGILYQIGDKIVCAEREMPNRDDYVFGGTSYLYDCIAWEKDCKDVVNVDFVDDEDQLGNHFMNPLIIFHDDLYCSENKVVYNGQKVLKIPEGEGVRITKII